MSDLYSFFLAIKLFVVVCCCLFTKLYPTPCDSMDCSTPGFPVLQYLPEFAQTHVHWVGGTSHPSHPLSPLSPPALNLSQYQSLLQWAGSFTSGGQNIRASTSSAVLTMNIQGWFPVGLAVWTPCGPKDSQESSPAPELKNISSLMFSLLYGPPLTSIHDYWKNHSFDYMEYKTSRAYQLIKKKINK